MLSREKARTIFQVIGTTGSDIEPRSTARKASILPLDDVFDKKTALYTRFRAKQKPETGLCVFSKEVEFMRWFPVAFLINGVLKVRHGGIELATLVRTLKNYTLFDNSLLIQPW